jgi:glucose/arabinose dehydrogenase
VAVNLTIPWDIDWLPDGSLLVTERPGQLLKVTPRHSVVSVQGVAHVGEGGLLGLAVHPDFPQNQFIYLYLTAATPEGLTNRVDRYRLIDDRLTDPRTILSNIPGARFHDGGRIVFGPDKLLYITTGDAGHEDEAQNTQSLAGKILRITDEGSVPADNPFGNAVYTYGHRNPQGLAWDNQGRLWSSEHGRSGLQSGFDEINLIERGKNYGWPIIQGDETRAGMESPRLHSGASSTWAPGGLVAHDTVLIFTGLRGESIYTAQVQQGNNLAHLRSHFTQEFGRLRTIKQGPDDLLYVTTSNKDGRGTPAADDDKIIRLSPGALNL